MMPTSPRVSICIPTYKGAATIGEAIDSVLAQTYTDFELIVVDDGSPDDTLGVVRARSDPRLRVLQNDSNLGPQGNWNRCLSLARGPYVKLLPHDDLLHPECLARQVPVLEQDLAQQLSLVWCARDVIGPQGRVLLRGRGFPQARPGLVTRREVVRQSIRRGTNLVGEPGAVLFRRELATRVGGFDQRFPYVIDLDYWLRLMAHGPGWYDPLALASFRVWSGSWSVAIGARQSADFRQLLDQVEAAGPPSTTAFDRLCGRFTPGLNRVARQVFYRLFV
jgi:glycosyltransferase involved in cell wall biosynthesis